MLRRSFRSLAAVLTASVVVSLAVGACAPGNEIQPDTTSASVPLSQVDLSPEIAPNAFLDAQPGLLLSKDWVTHGKYELLRPAQQLDWPEASVASGEIKLDTRSEPVRLDLRYILDELPASGVPRDDPLVQSCSTNASTEDRASCTLVERGDAVAVQFLAPKAAKAVILNAAWFASPTDRGSLTDAPGLNSISVGWRIKG